MRRVLVLRPEPGASATVERARAQGLDAFAVPLFAIEPLDWDVPQAAHYDGLLLTSASALLHRRTGLESLHDLPVYAVGERTAEAAREAGFSISSIGHNGVDDLLRSVDAGLSLLHLCGEDRRDPDEARQNITALPTYRSRPIEAPDLREVRGAVALIHSPRAGRRFAELVRDRGSIAIAAISGPAAEAAGNGWARVEAAENPNDEALLALAARLCNKPGPQ